MTTTTFQIDFDDLRLTVSQVEEVMGYKEGDDRSIVSDLIDEILKESRLICNIKAQYTIFQNIHFENNSKSLNINDINFRIKKIVYGQLKKSESLAIFLCTAGAEIGIRSRKIMQEKDLLKGYIYDVIGSEIVEAAGDIMHKELGNKIISAGNKITNRFSPGYCGWDVAEQHKLFQLVPGNFCGIRLTESALMDPVKSISGFIGIGKNVKMIPYTCSLCDMDDCNYRKHRVTLI